MITTDVVKGTAVFKSVDKETGREFFWFRTPNGQTGGVVDRNGNIPEPHEAVLIIPDEGKPFIGFSQQEPVFTY